MKILYLDKVSIGGSRRSLEVLQRYLPPEVDYRTIMINDGLKPSSRNNLLVFLIWAVCKSWRFVFNFWRVWWASRAYDLIHINHDALWLYLFVPGKPKIMHMRTMLPKSWFANIQAGVILMLSSGLIFITDNERCRFDEFFSYHTTHGEHNYHPGIDAGKGRSHAAGMYPVEVIHNAAN